ncbi:hypothetical protein M9458_021194 [Cirrhinus mrigala]|uniref:Uncharacterized protein n=1 Tax=Cirrhinus mrigala TaxID=683832 RepID=A0ABD0QGZ2_CIRMR
MDPLASRLPHTVTEYSVTQGSSSFTPGLSTAHYSTLPDCIIIEIFCDGVNEPLKARLRREGPRSSLATFMDFALLCVGSPFTVGVAEEERDNAVMPAAHPSAPIMAALPDAVPESSHITAAVTAKSSHVAAEVPVLSQSSQDITAPPESRQIAAAVPRSSQATAVVPVSSKATAVVPVSSKATAVSPKSSQVTAVVPEPSKVTAVVPESSKVTAVIPESSQVRAVVPESSKDPAGLYEPSQVIADPHKPSQVIADLHEPIQVTTDLHEPSQVTADLHEPGHVIAAVPELSHIPSDGPESSHVPSDGPEPSHVSSVRPEPSHVSSDRPEPRHVSSDILWSRPFMMASVLDPPLVSVRAANISGAPAHHKTTINEVLPPAAALPLMAVAIWCVWAAHCAPEVSSVHKSAPEVTSIRKSAPEVMSVRKSAPEVPSDLKSAPEVPSDLKSAPEAPSDLKSAPEVPSALKSAPEISTDRLSAPVPPEMLVLAAESPKGAADTTIETPEVAAFAAEPLEVAAPTVASPVAEMPAAAAEPRKTGTSALAPCTVVTPYNPHPGSVPRPGLVTATRAVYELSSSLPILSASSVPALPRSQSMTRVPAPPWRAPAAPAPPWRAPAPLALPPAPPWRAPALPAPPPDPPWRVPALLVLPRSPGPLHGPGPPTLALSRSRPTAPLDCCSVGASGSRSLGGGGLHSPSFSALIGSVTNQRRYKSPGLSPCKPRSIVVVVVVISIVVVVIIIIVSVPILSPGHLVSSVSPPAYWTLTRLTDYSPRLPLYGLCSPLIDPRLLHGLCSSCLCYTRLLLS